MSRAAGVGGLLVVVLIASQWSVARPSVGDGKLLPEKVQEVDASTMRHKVLCGYQGWFRCPGDPAGVGWRHWSRSADRITPDRVTFEMWPDLSEAGDGEKYPAPGFTHPDGTQAHLFSSADSAT